MDDTIVMSGGDVTDRDEKPSLGPIMPRADAALSPQVAGASTLRLMAILRNKPREGSRVNAAGMSPTDITLLFDENMRPIAAEEIQYQRLASGAAIRIVAAYIDKPSLTALRAGDLPGLRNVAEALPETVTELLEWQASRFMELKGRDGPPYYAAFGGMIDWRGRDREGLTFRRTPDPVIGEGPWDMRERQVKAVADRFSSSIGVTLHKYPDENFGLDDDDLRLVHTWANVDVPDNPIDSLKSSNLKFPRFWNLLCARLAEKTVASYYSAHLPTPVEDCSILQLDGSDRRWRDFDLWAGKPVDVKNSMGVNWSRRQNYVSKLKLSHGQDVTIAAVASSRDQDGTTIRQIFLGEVRRIDIQETKKAVHAAFPDVDTIRISVDDRHLPAWIFENPFSAMDYDNLLEAYLILADRPESILASAIAAGKPESTRTYGRLSTDQRMVVDRLSEVIKKSSYSKRTIAMFAISAFLSDCLAGRDPTGFIRYYRKLFAMEGLGERERFAIGTRRVGKFSESQSGGLHDPLRSIPDLLDLLGKVGEAVMRLRFTFVAFHTPSPYILLGRLLSGEKMTLYAYCGGLAESGEVCNAFPLVLGHNRNCGKCGKLICHRCGHCSDECHRYGSRERKPAA